jgi:glycosyl transferase family 25
MSAQFERLKLTVERVSATDAQDPQIRVELMKHPAAASLSLGALACFESHRRVWKRLIESGASHAMIFEDDLLIAPALTDYQDSRWIPEEAELIKIETNGTRLHLARQALCKIGPERSLARLGSYHSATGGYIVSARLAQKLLPLSRDSIEPVDDFLFDRNGLHNFPIYQMIPAPVVQGASRLAQAAAASWAESSLTEHWAEGVGDATDRVETKIGRVTRRIREEMRARRLGTRYAAVPWG